MSPQQYIWALPMMLMMAFAGCSSTGDWPNLSDKMPDPATRTRAIERADPSIAPRVEEKVPTSLAEAEALLATVTTDAGAARETYVQALEVFNNAGPDNNDKVHLWLEAQLALTRLSQTISRLDVILFDDGLATSELGERAKAQKQDIDALVVAERQALAAAKPAGIS